jgi:hypothetical protein
VWSLFIWDAIARDLITLGEAIDMLRVEVLCRRAGL